MIEYSIYFLIEITLNKTYLGNFETMPGIYFSKGGLKHKM